MGSLVKYIKKIAKTTAYTTLNTMLTEDSKLEVKFISVEATEKGLLLRRHSGAAFVT